VPCLLSRCPGIIALAVTKTGCKVEVTPSALPRWTCKATELTLSGATKHETTPHCEPQSPMLVATNPRGHAAICTLPSGRPSVFLDTQRFRCSPRDIS
jgi:hypothetical protein